VTLLHNNAVDKIAGEWMFTNLDPQIYMQVNKNLSTLCIKGSIDIFNRERTTQYLQQVLEQFDVSENANGVARFKRKSIVKKISKNGIVCNCDKLSDMDLFKWVKKKFESKNVVIENAQIMYFIDSEGYRDKSSEKTLSDLDNEINKISSFVGKGNIVTNETIDKLSQKKVENDIFKLIDYIGEKDSSNAIRILNDMIQEGESVLGIFAMIAKQFRVVMQVRQYQVEGYTSKVISEKLKIHTFVVGKALKQASNFSDDMIIDMLNYILESDYKIKNGLIKDTLAVEILVSKYCDRKIS
jgi:DNA polymerase-3 subunit delta